MTLTIVLKLDPYVIVLNPLSSQMSSVAAFPRIDVITGPMFSGKTTTLLNRLTTQLAAGKRVIYVNFAGDNRSDQAYSTHSPIQWLLSHDNFTAYKYNSLTEFMDEHLEEIKYANVIGIDEAQFFPDIYECTVSLCEKNYKHVIIAALNGNFKRELLGNVHKLLPHADNWKHLQAICKNCADVRGDHRPALFSYLTHTNVSDAIDPSKANIGGADKYAAVCRSCYVRLAKQ